MSFVRRLRALIATATFLCAFLFAGPARAGVEVPPPPEGEAAATVLAILIHDRGLCSGIAQDLLAYWRGRDGSRSEGVRDYLTRQKLAELAAARTASDIARSLLPQARSESGAEVALALERLHGEVVALCDAVALPRAPRATFGERVAGLEARIDREREALGNLLVVPEDALEPLLDPYLLAIQLAGFEAESEFLDYLDSQRQPPAGPTLQELMNAWHAEYLAAVVPTKQALGRYLIARGQNDPRAMAAACREISAAVLPLLRQGEIFQIPTPLIPASRGFTRETLPPLEQAYREIRDMAVDCTAGKSREVLDHLREMERQLQLAAGRLEGFGLKP